MDDEIGRQRLPAELGTDGGEIITFAHDMRRRGRHEGGLRRGRGRRSGRFINHRPQRSNGSKGRQRPFGRSCPAKEAKAAKVGKKNSMARHSLLPSFPSRPSRDICLQTESPRLMSICYGRRSLLNFPALCRRSLNQSSRAASSCPICTCSRGAPQARNGWPRWRDHWRRRMCWC